MMTTRILRGPPTRRPRRTGFGSSAPRRHRSWSTSESARSRGRPKACSATARPTRSRIARGSACGHRLSCSRGGSSTQPTTSQALGSSSNLARAAAPRPSLWRRPNGAATSSPPTARPRRSRTVATTWRGFSPLLLHHLRTSSTTSREHHRNWPSWRSTGAPSTRLRACRPHFATPRLLRRQSATTTTTRHRSSSSAPTSCIRPKSSRALRGRSTRSALRTSGTSRRPTGAAGTTPSFGRSATTAASTITSRPSRRRPTWRIL
mmetsp:Transcript_11224/g.45458  ORF Transcript_11224/g.45458 Transcript_11224/m.45458 type:complete len:263 (-) Transcript_11224:188-976(-)